MCTRPSCDVVLPARKPTGRPRRYCSRRCGRLVSYSREQAAVRQDRERARRRRAAEYRRHAEANRQRRRAYVREHPEKCQKGDRAYARRHADRIRARKAAYRERNRAVILARDAEYRQRHKEQKAAYNAKYRRRRGLDTGGTNNHERRARRYGVPYERVNLQAVYKRDGWRCQLCGLPVDPSLRWPDRMMATPDCVVPMSKGGGFVTANVQLAHWNCNSRKNNQLMRGGAAVELPARRVSPPSQPAHSRVSRGQLAKNRAGSTSG